MSSIHGYATLVGHEHITRLAKKPLIGKPTVLYGPALSVAASLYEIGAILSVLHRDRIMDFADAFMGLRGEAENARAFLALQTERELSSVDDDASLLDAAMANEARRISFPGAFEDLFLQMGNTKVTVEDALRMVTHASLHGLALGAIEPDLVRRRFDASNVPMDPAEYEVARQAGLDLIEPETTTWEEQTALFDESFREFCRDENPNLYTRLYD